MIHCANSYFYLVAELRLHCLWECLLRNGLLCPVLMATTMAIQTLANVATLYRPLLCPILVKFASGVSTSIGSLKGVTPVDSNGLPIKKIETSGASHKTFGWKEPFFPALLSTQMADWHGIVSAMRRAN